MPGLLAGSKGICGLNSSEQGETRRLAGLLENFGFYSEGDKSHWKMLKKWKTDVNLILIS